MSDTPRNNIEKVRKYKYLDKSFDSSDFFDQDDSDLGVDPDFSLSSTRQDSLPRQGRLILLQILN